MLTLPQSPSLHLLFSLFYNNKSTTKTPYEFTQTSAVSKDISQCMAQLKHQLHKAVQEITMDTSKYMADALTKGLKLIKGQNKTQDNWTAVLALVSSDVSSTTLKASSVMPLVIFYGIGRYLDNVGNITHYTRSTGSPSSRALYDDWKSQSTRLSLVSPCALLTWFTLTTLRQRDLSAGLIPFLYLNNFGGVKSCACYVRGGLLARMLPYRTSHIINAKTAQKFVDYYTKPARQYDFKSFRFLPATTCFPEDTDQTNRIFYIVFIGSEMVHHMRPLFAESTQKNKKKK